MGALFALAAVSGYGEAALSKPTLRIYTWSDYIAKAVIDRFEKEYGCKVVIDTFDSNETLFEKLKTGKADYDIAMPSSYLIPAMEENGMIRPLDHKKLPNVRKNFDAHYAGCILDPSFFFSVPYSMTLTGFVYRKDKIGAAPVNSWDVFETAAFKGRINAKYLNSFLSMKYSESTKLDEGKCNGLRSVFGLPLQGTITTKCDMFCNRYPLEDALKLFGAMKGKGAQDIK